MPAAIENVKGITRIVMYTGTPLSISDQSSPRSPPRKVEATKMRAGAVAKDGIDAKSGSRNKQHKN